MALQDFDLRLAELVALYDALLVINTYGAIEADGHKAMIVKLDETINAIRNGVGIKVARVVSGKAVADVTALRAGDSLNSTALAAGDIILLMHQTTLSENGLWEIAAGDTTPLRPTSFSPLADQDGLLVIVTSNALETESIFRVKVSLGDVTVTTVASDAPPAVTSVATSTYIILESDTFLSVSTIGTLVLTIPTALNIDGKTFTIKDSGFNAATNNITIECEDSGDKIEGSTSDLVLAVDGVAINLTFDEAADTWLVW